jgi:TatD DNase family protein
VRLVDSHGHVQSPAFDRDRDDVLARARDAGLERLLAPGWDLESSRQSARLAEGMSWIEAAAGIHPHVAAGADEATWRAIVELASDPGVVAVGETGLDYDRAFSPRGDQVSNLRRHLALAADLGKPVILHCRSRPGARDAQDELLHEVRSVPGVHAVVHSFSGPVDYARAMLDLGATLSFSGLVFRRGEEQSATVAAPQPLDRLLVETDSPYLSPPGAPRRRNEPRYVETTLRWLAGQRGEEPSSLAEQLVTNYAGLFRGATGAES